MSQTFTRTRSFALVAVAVTAIAMIVAAPASAQTKAPTAREVVKEIQEHVGEIGRAHV